MASSKVSDPLDDIVKELELDLDDDIELFDESLAEALNEDLDANPIMSKTVNAMLQTPNNEDEEIEIDDVEIIDDDQGDASVVVPKQLLEPEVIIKEEVEPLQPIPTERLSSSPRMTPLPQYLDVRLFVRLDSAKRSPATTPYGSFMVPFLTNSLCEFGTYRVMFDLATTIIKRSRPYVKASTFFFVHVLRPTFA